MARASTLSQHQIDAFWRDGAVVAPNAASAADLRFHRGKSTLSRRSLRRP